MTYVEGDPGHIDVHESIRLLFMAAGLDPSLIPAEATLGATTHISDHNKIADALAWLDENGIPGAPAAVVSGTTGSPTTGTGKYSKALYTWTGAGDVTFSSAGRIRVLAVGGGCCTQNVGALNSGGGGEVQDYELDVEAGTYTITIGSGGLYVGQTNGGESSFILANKRSVRARGGTAFLLGDGANATDATGIYSDISGLSVGYGGAGIDDATNYNSAFGGNNSSGQPRANSGGGGGQAGTGNGAAGILQLLV